MMTWLFKTPQCRHLTDGEKQLAYQVFGEALDVSDVQLKTAWWVLKNYAVSPNGHIYFHHANFKADFSQENLSQQAWLIHELTHVWQVQQGIPVFFKALFNRRYDYVFTPNKPFLSYGVEQQARMVEDYFIRQYQQQDCQAWQDCIPFVKSEHDL